MIMIMILRDSNLHMPEICGKICRMMCGIRSIYVPHTSPNSAYFPAYFASKTSAYFKEILRYKPTSLNYSNMLRHSSKVHLKETRRYGSTSKHTGKQYDTERL